MLQAELRGCPLADQLSIKTEDTLRRHVYCCPSECISAILALTFYFLYRCWAGIFTLRGIDRSYNELLRRFVVTTKRLVTVRLRKDILDLPGVGSLLADDRR